MASITARGPYLVGTTVKDLLSKKERWCRYCCRICFSDLTLRRITAKGVSGSSFEAENDFHHPKLIKYSPRVRGVSSKPYITVNDMIIVEILMNMLGAEKNFVLNEVRKHPKRKFFKAKEVERSVQFLQSEGFSKELIRETIAICFYPRENIEQGFEEIKRNDEELRKIGYVNGILEKDTVGFSSGSVSKDKRLQLCLYYMELPFNFNGSGIFPSA